MYMFYINFILFLLIIIGGLNWGSIGVFDYNIVDKITYNNKYISKIVYITVGIASILLIIQRNVRLPFLGDTIMPPSVFKVSKPSGKKITLKIETPEKNISKIVYWASIKEADNPKDAYGNFENAGVEDVSSNITEISLNNPSKYKVGLFKRELPKHVHYRFIYKNGWVSDVKTKEVTDY